LISPSLQVAGNPSSLVIFAWLVMGVFSHGAGQWVLGRLQWWVGTRRGRRCSGRRSWRSSWALAALHSRATYRARA